MRSTHPIEESGAPNNPRRRAAFDMKYAALDLKYGTCQFGTRKNQKNRETFFKFLLAPPTNTTALATRWYHTGDRRGAILAMHHSPADEACIDTLAPRALVLREQQNLLCIYGTASAPHTCIPGYWEDQHPRIISLPRGMGTRDRHDLLIVVYFPLHRSNTNLGPAGKSDSVREVIDRRPPLSPRAHQFLNPDPWVGLDAVAPYASTACSPYPPAVISLRPLPLHARIALGRSALAKIKALLTRGALNPTNTRISGQSIFATVTARPTRRGTLRRRLPSPRRKPRERCRNGLTNPYICVGLRSPEALPAKVSGLPSLPFGVLPPRCLLRWIPDFLRRLNLIDYDQQ
ncbi:hypothetical protein DFH09DRAFT_1083401 [Mycena vulgaris]|nr:hypothetical protein DFH09DRAFT_1083401 [Mycena vulgaris]